MSELINNQKKRQEQLKKLILQLHEGVSFEEVKKQFEEEFGNVSAKEISDIEQALIKEGMKVEKIQKLCDVHAAVFKGSIYDIHKPENEEQEPGHPVHTFLLENVYIKNKVTKIKLALEENNLKNALENLNLLTEIDKHYARKENLIFSLLERHDISGPPKVMWAIDDEIRVELKEIISSLNSKGDLQKEKENIEGTLHKISEMIYKEDSILIPMALETFSTSEWIEIEKASDEFGYSFVKVVKMWKPRIEETKEEMKNESEDEVQFGAGSLTQEQLNAMLNTLPFDITFVDSNNEVKYFSEGTERIFPRPRTIIGRQVSNCHPPASVHIVEKIVSDFREGKKDHEDFWLKLGDKFAYIRYYAVRNEKGEFLGTLEVTQNIKDIKQLEGEKRLVEE